MPPPPPPPPPTPSSAALDLAAAEATARRIVEDVGETIVRPSMGGPLSDHHWRTHTQVHTVDDHEAGMALIESLRAAFPDHGLVVEDCDPVEGDGRHVWHVDPIDGSANHLRGIPYVSVTAGLVVDGEPVVGVVHDIVRDVTWSAHAGGGARVHDGDGVNPTAVASTAGLGDAMVIAHLSRRGPLVAMPGVLQDLLWNVRKIRCMGSIALDLGLLAAGEADLLVVGRGTPQRMLDILGGMVVLREAGGAVMTAAGGPVDETTRTLVAGPPDLCRAFVELMAGHDLEGWTSDRARRPDA